MKRHPIRSIRKRKLLCRISSLFYFSYQLHCNGESSNRLLSPNYSVPQEVCGDIVCFVVAESRRKNRIASDRDLLILSLSATSEDIVANQLVIIDPSTLAIRDHHLDPPVSWFTRKQTNSLALFLPYLPLSGRLSSSERQKEAFTNEVISKVIRSSSLEAKSLALAEYLEFLNLEICQSD